MGQTSTGLIDLLQAPGPQPEAWGRFVAFYTAELLRWARAHGLQEADAKDVAQDILASIRERLKKYQRVPGGSFGGWLYRVVANECRARQRRRTREAGGAAGLSEVADPLETPAFEAAEEAAHRRRLVQRAMARVRAEFMERTWAAFHALAIEGRRAADVARELGMTRGQVHLARHAVVKRLREVVQGLLD